MPCLSSIPFTTCGLSSSPRKGYLYYSITMVLDIEKVEEKMWYRDWYRYIMKRLNSDPLNIWDILRENKVQLSISVVNSNRWYVYELIDNAQNVYDTIFISPEELETFIAN